MANQSIYNAFQRMWEHATSAFSKIDHTHENYIDQENFDTKIAEVDEVLEQKADASLLDSYETKDDANLKLDEAKGYTDSIASGKADAEHDHNDSYYIKDEIEEKLSSKANITALTDGTLVVASANYAQEANIANKATSADEAIKATTDSNDNIIVNTYETKDDATVKLAEANSYTDDKVSNLASTIVVDNKIVEHNVNTEAHNDIRTLIDELNKQLEHFLNVDDTTKDELSEVLALIEANRSTLESLTTLKINVSDIVDNLTTASTDRVLSANQGVVLNNLISTLNTELEALESTVNTHNHDDRYYTEEEINDQVSTINTSISNIVDGVTVVEKASKDASGNVITTTYETKTDAENKVEAAKNELQTNIDAKMNAVDPVGSGSFSFGRTDGTTVGTNSVAIGYDVVASGKYSYAEGIGTQASGDYSHAEGYLTKALGEASHAEGSFTQAEGKYSHVEGDNLFAKGDYQHVQGKCNISDTTSAHIVGNGTSSARSNAHTLDWDGNAWFAGDVYVGSTSGTKKDDGSVKLVTETAMTTALDALELITVDDIDTIYSASIQSINEVTF